MVQSPLSDRKTVTVATIKVYRIASQLWLFMKCRRLKRKKNNNKTFQQCGHYFF